MAAVAVRADVVAYSSTISALEGGFRWRAALAVFRDLQETRQPLNMVVYTAVLGALRKAQQGHLAQQLLLDAVRACLQPDDIAYSAAISACERGQHWRSALSLLAAMRAAGLGSSVVASSAAVSALEKGARWQAALSVVREMGEVSLQPNLVTLNSALHCCEHALLWRESLSLVAWARQRQDSCLDTVGLTAAVHTCEVALASSHVPPLLRVAKLRASRWAQGDLKLEGAAAHELLAMLLLLQRRDSATVSLGLACERRLQRPVCDYLRGHGWRSQELRPEDVSGLACVALDAAEQLMWSFPSDVSSISAQAQARVALCGSLLRSDGASASGWLEVKPQAVGLAVWSAYNLELPQSGVADSRGLGLQA
eukprot:TRINITY_DN74499_c0_g1_i1.p1 TRINITY_DN74499_c0_g1~~TRINITY_DN74499_c0_g1_i1.p1  ORF type:complete len:388 (+),score=74.88 TRINITY_DN74499_c0_g1_i1:63-1166(+)